MTKTVLITGGSRGIGNACAKLFAERGCNVVLTFNTNEDKARETVNQIKAAGGNAVAVKADIADVDDIDALVKVALKQFGKIDVLINNAGIAKSGLFIDSTQSDVDRVIDVDLKGAINVTRAVLPQMMARGSGNIVNISSVWGQTGGSCETLYSAAKAGLIGFTKALAKETALCGVRVNCVSPGVIDTDMLDNLTDADKNELKEQTPLNRLGTAKDVAKAVYFLTDDDSDFITGQILAVNGGFYI